MINFKTVILFFRDWLQFFFWMSRAGFLSYKALALENSALRSQLSVFQRQMIDHKISKPHVTPAFRQVWVLLSKVFPQWKSALFLFKPETVIGWHKKAFKFYWMLKSKKPGRPKISRQQLHLSNVFTRKIPYYLPKRYMSV